jgi:PBSX family phage terminase large subunit
MADIIFDPFDKQNRFLASQNRRKSGFSGKRGGKTEVGAIQGIIYQEQKPGWVDNKIDPFVGVIIAPTTDMLRRLSFNKFLSYAKPFIRQYNKSTYEITWYDGSKIYGLSADKPERIEGVKANWIWIDEAAQVSHQVFLECNARIADSKGYLFLTTSLGVQYINPRNHWLYKEMKESNSFKFDVFEWATADNPHFPREELESLKNALDPRTYRAMFELDWNIPASNRVYDDFSDDNISENLYNPQLPVYVSVDWGWNDPTVFLFIQYDPRRDTVYVIDEIVKTKTKLSDIVTLVKQKPYRVAEWYCDAAGLQTNEQTARSNVQIMKEDFGIHFKWRRTNIIPGIALVRSYVKTGKGEIKLLVDRKCQSTIDEFLGYRFKEKSGMVLDEPMDKDNHTADAMRYWFVNFMADRKAGDTIVSLDKWKFLEW